MMDDRWVYGEDIDPDDCHLWNCVEPSRKITDFVAMVIYEGITVPMHIPCARLFSTNVKRVSLQQDCREMARWN